MTLDVCLVYSADSLPNCCCTDYVPKVCSLPQQSPAFLAPGIGFTGNSCSTEGNRGMVFRMILLRSPQPRSLAYMVHSSICVPMRIKCHWSDKRWSSGSNMSDGEADVNTDEAAHLPASHLLLCGPLPNRPWTATGLWLRSGGPLLFPSLVETVS